MHKSEGIVEIDRNERKITVTSRLSVSENNFKEYKSPYLFEKQMRRDYMVFEMFSLVTASKNE